MEHLLLVFVSFMAGLGVSAGTFAFIIVIGVVPRLMRKMHIDDILGIENIIVLGVICGNLLSLFEGRIIPEPFILADAVIIVYGLCTGVFVGCMSVALAEILHTFPVIFRRFNLKGGLRVVVFAMALGKLVGGILYFALGYFHTA